MAKRTIIRFPDVARADRPRWLRNDRNNWTVKFRPGKAAKSAKAAQEPTAPDEPAPGRKRKMDSSIPHYWDLMLMREILDLPDSPRSYATKEERKVAESKAMEAQRRIARNFASKYIEKEKQCQRLEAENKKLREQLSSSKTPSASRKS